MSHTSNTRTIETEEKFDTEGRVTWRKVTDTWDEFTDLDIDLDDDDDDYYYDDDDVTDPIEDARQQFANPSPDLQWFPIDPSITIPSLPKSWEWYCMNGVEPCPTHDIRYPGRSAG